MRRRLGLSPCERIYALFYATISSRIRPSPNPGDSRACCSLPLGRARTDRPYLLVAHPVALLITESRIAHAIRGNTT